jgi:hypothetical protein
MILYSDKDDHYSHRVRIVLAEKDIACEIRETSNEEAPEEVLALNPYHTLPILAIETLVYMMQESCWSILMNAFLIHPFYQYIQSQGPTVELLC